MPEASSHLQAHNTRPLNTNQLHTEVAEAKVTHYQPAPVLSVTMVRCPNNCLNGSVMITCPSCAGHASRYATLIHASPQTHKTSPLACLRHHTSRRALLSISLSPIPVPNASTEHPSLLPCITPSPQPTTHLSKATRAHRSRAANTHRAAISRCPQCRARGWIREPCPLCRRHATQPQRQQQQQQQ